MILNIEIYVNVVNWIHIVLINRTSLMTLNIEISMKLVNLIQTVLINRTFLHRNDNISNCFTMSAMAK